MQKHLVIQLREYTIRNTFLEKSYAKCEEKLFSDFFVRKQLSISLDQ